MKKVRALAFLATAGSALACAGCASERGAPARPVAARAAPPVRSIAVSPADYVARAASASLFVIKASEQIAEREGYSGLGQAARRFQSEQQGVGSQLSFAGRRLNLLPSATLLPADQMLLDELRASANPGATYVRQLKNSLPRALSLHRQYQRYGTSPTLRPVAAMAAPVFAAELEAIGRF